MKHKPYNNTDAASHTQEALVEIKILMNDIDTQKPQHLRKHIHHHWGSIVGNEKEIRLAVLLDELETWKQRDTDCNTYVLEKRIKELNAPKELPRFATDKEANFTDNVIQEHEATWGKEYENER